MPSIRSLQQTLTWVWPIITAGVLQAQPPKQMALTPPSPDSLRHWMKASQVPTLGIAYLEAGRLKQTWVGGILPGGVPAPANTIFYVASLTKPVTALTTLRLIDQGQWSLDSPLAPDWIDPDVQADSLHNRLTSRLVLSHQTGFPNWRWQEKANKLSFGFPPGARWQYSGEGYEYLRHALEHRFGKSLDELADSLVFKPLGMRDSRYCWTPTMPENRFAGSYDKAGKPYETYRNQEPNAANWLLTTVEDYGHFAQWVLKGAGLSRPVFDQMVKAQVAVIPSRQVAWGLGWALVEGLPNNEYALFHGGGGQGATTAVLLLPQSGRGLVIFTNSDTGQEVYKRIIRHSLDVGPEILQRFEP